MEDRLKYTKQQLQAALIDFSDSLNIELDQYPELVRDTLKNGHVQKFEFSIELLWKTIKIFLHDVHGLDVRSPKESIKKFFELEYCDYQESEVLLLAIDSRNALSHVYKKEQFELIYSDISGYMQTMMTVADRELF